MSKSTRNSLLLVLTAFIWGTAFVAQSTGGDALGPYTFNCIRNFVGALVLFPVIRILEKLGLSKGKPETKEDKKILWTGGICCGICLCIASNLQQVGINMGTPTGKAGFLTACYIILVPILGLFLKKKCGWNIWFGVVLTVWGLYLLCMTGGFYFQYSDILLMLCALGFSVHILIIDHFSPLTDGVRLSQIQFLVCAILTVIPMIFSDLRSAGAASWAAPFTTMSAWGAILYAGVFSSGVAYTLQIVGQVGVNPTLASLLMSLESVFATLAGWLFLRQILSVRELAGCALIFAAVILAQIPVETIFKEKTVK